MAFRVEKAVAAIGLIVASIGYAEEASVAAVHNHVRGEGRGQLIATDDALRFEEVGKHADHKWSLAWDDIQELWISPDEVRVTTYADVWWRLGEDREHRLKAARGSTFEPLYRELKDRLDQRLVAALADEPADVLWQSPAKLREKFGGPEGVLVVARDRLAFRSPDRGESRTWRIEDIESVSSAGPFDLTITTHERAFTFQMKQALKSGRYDTLWRRINETKQLDYLREIGEKQK